MNVTVKFAYMYKMCCNHIHTSIAFFCPAPNTPADLIPLPHLPQLCPPFPFSSSSPPTEFNPVIGSQEQG